MFLDINTVNAEAFLKSALTMETSLSKMETVFDWISDLKSKTHSEIRKVPFCELAGWKIDDKMGSIVHESGKFFSIEGYHVETNFGNCKSWDQPLINQAEIGYLGFIVKEFDGILHFLVQAKIEPGNSNIIQLSPTLQATRSNYTQVHKGRKPRYLEYFQTAKPSQVLLDQLQSEQGSRFLKKRNRNIIIKIDDPIQVYDNFRWLTLGQIKALMSHDNIINMDSRTVISGIQYGNGAKLSGANDFLASMLASKKEVNSLGSMISKLTHFKSLYDLDIRQVPLSALSGWVFGDHEIKHCDDAYFRVIAVNVEIEGREVQSWMQPMVEPAEAGLCAFICKKINGVLHLAVQVKMECGNHDAFEFAPTVQLLEGHDNRGKTIGIDPFESYVRNARPEQILYDAVQAEEGGRFYRDDNRNCIVLADDDFPEALPENFIWMTLRQISSLLRANNVFNIQARSLIAAIRFD